MCSSTKPLDQYHAFYIVIDGERFYFGSEKDAKLYIQVYNDLTEENINPNIVKVERKK